MKGRLVGLSLVLCSVTPAPGATISDKLPACLSLNQASSIEASVMKGSPGTTELLARLAYAEGRSTGFPEDPLVYQGIAWGVTNRVRLGEASPQMRRRYGDGLRGVIFRKGQFNPALSPRSPYSADFLCPKHDSSWRRAIAAATTALRGAGNPFIQTDWERAHGLSLVVNFYYPASTQAKGPLAPWEASAELGLIGPVAIDGGLLQPERIRFYRLRQPPGDLAGRPPGE